MFALTDLEICTMGLCATIVFCTIGLGTSIYHHLRGTTFHISYEIRRSADSIRCDCKPQLKLSAEGAQQRNCPKPQFRLPAKRAPRSKRSRPDKFLFAS
jgi:hypothetical protein